MDPNKPANNHTLGEIVGGLATDVQDLVRGEIALARAEVDEKLHRLVGAFLWILGGFLVAFAGLVVLLEGGAAALALRLPVWAALLIVGVIVIVVGALVAGVGRGMLSRKSLAPARTAANLQQDTLMVKEHMR
ncbi:phage holin family protein [Dongia soli]|uniref:Phage holin family protein n=1 Tax=Dongia soli TaxID=600628 RepID=A0ABU5EBQ0_9PROT|nr:phage holin family protein [Dongia soli]MDY0883613.1 phage holin family protein [Dongia soli]